MSDVLADAQDMRDAFLNELYARMDRKSDAELEHDRYKVGELARQGNFYAIDVVLCINCIMLHRTVTTLCEGCLDRYGCDMCCPPDFSRMAEAYNRELEAESLGRPLFPNEY